MVFSSVIFLFFFLPVFLLLYFLIALPKAIRKGNVASAFTNLLILLSSVIFYAWGERLLVLIMLTSTAIDYVAGMLISGAWGRMRGKELVPLDPEGPRSALQKGALVVSIVANLSFLCVFKYFNFFVDSFNSLFSSIGLHGLVASGIPQIALPIGISFYTFQSMSYTIDIYRGETTATRSLIDFACFVTMFSQLIAGPIIRYRDIAPQLTDRKVTLDGFAYGVGRFVVGLGKKVLIADVLALTVDKVYSLPASELGMGVAWLGAVCFVLQIYYDFSGYSDMAIGLGRMMGFHFPENFNYPLISRSIREFWQRWHISLSTWFRDYLYFPLGGNRGSQGRTLFNLVIVFFLCGLWHGALWTFAIWGLLNGVFMIFERQGLERWLRSLWRPLPHIYFCLFFVLTLVLFRAQSFAQTGEFLAAMFGFGSASGAVMNFQYYFNPELMIVLAAAVIGSMPWVPALGKRIERLAEEGKGIVAAGVTPVVSLARMVAISAIFILAVMYVANVTYNPFIYFRF